MLTEARTLLTCFLLMLRQVFARAIDTDGIGARVLVTKPAGTVAAAAAPAQGAAAAQVENPFQVNLVLTSPSPRRSMAVTYLRRGR